MALSLPSLPAARGFASSLASLRACVQALAHLRGAVRIGAISRAHAVSIALLALATLAIAISVLWREGMAVDAVRLGPPHFADNRGVAAVVLPLRQQLKVQWIHAHLHPASVMQGHPAWYVLNEQLVNESMRGPVMQAPVAIDSPWGAGTDPTLVLMVSREGHNRPQPRIRTRFVHANKITPPSSLYL